MPEDQGRPRISLSTDPRFETTQRELRRREREARQQRQEFWTKVALSVSIVFLVALVIEPLLRVGK